MDTPEEELSLRTWVFAYLCNHLPLIVGGFALLSVALLITLYNIWRSGSGEGTFVIGVLSLPGLVAAIAASGYVIYRCKRMREQRDVDLDEVL